MLNLRTDPRLLDALKSASMRYPSVDQIERQRLSFVMGTLSTANHMTRQDVKKIIDLHEGRNNTQNDPV